MFQNVEKLEGSAIQSRGVQPPHCPESEMLVLLQGFLAPILHTATSWAAMSDQLAQKGYKFICQDGHGLVYSQESSRYICTSAHLGMPLEDIIKRLGAPSTSH